MLFHFYVAEKVDLAFLISRIKFFERLLHERSIQKLFSNAARLVLSNDYYIL